MVLSDGTVCNISQFFSSHNTNQAFSSSSMSVSKAYIKTISSTLDEMGIKKNKLQNLASTTISNMIGNYDSLDSFIKESTQFNLKFYIYPPESDLNHDLKSYTNLIADKAKISYFKAKYFYLNYDIYLKAAGAFASDGNLQSIMPIFLGKVTIRTDNNAFSITLEVSNEAIIYGIAVQATNLIKPNGTEVALGINGDGKIAVGVDSQQTTLDNDGNIRVVTLKFSNLTNNITYTICYVAGLPIPKNRDTLVSETVYFVNATPQNPAIPSENKRILIGDEEDDA